LSWRSEAAKKHFLEAYDNENGIYDKRHLRALGVRRQSRHNSFLHFGAYQRICHGFGKCMRQLHKHAERCTYSCGKRVYWTMIEIII
jgi:hypothetical protein